MQLLIKKATIIHPDSPHNGQILDLLIKDGIIVKIDNNITTNDAQIIDNQGIHVSPGWLDIGVQVCDPGYEHREDLETVAAAAMVGGFTGIATQPNTDPTVHSKSQVLYLKNNTQNSLVDFFPMAAVSHDCEGKDITEMIDMHHAGAVAFTDGKNAIQDNGMMMRALQYVKTFDGLVINHPHDKSVAFGGQIHEGIVSTSLGMKGIPSLSENLMVVRDLYLAEYTDSNLHLANISTAYAVDLVRKAKKKGLKITASVAALNLAFDDSVLTDFNSNFKVLPPLREKSDQRELQKGVIDGTIDLVTSNHVPWHEESKVLEFSYADFGAIGLETTFGLTNKILHKKLNINDLINKLAIKSRQILNIPIPAIQENAPANLTIFQPDETWEFSKKDIYSKSKNTPLLGETLRGKILGVVNKGQSFICKK